MASHSSLYGRQLDLDEVVLGVGPLRGPPVHQDGLLGVVGLVERRERCGLRTGVDDFEIEAQALDDGLVEDRVRRVGAEEPALVAGLGRREGVGVAFEALPRGVLGVLLDDVGRREPSDVADDAQLAAVDDGAGLLDVVLAILQVTGRPHLERGVDVAVGHRRELPRLVDLLQLDRAAHLVLHHGLRHRRVRLGPDPGVHGDRDRVARTLGGGGRAACRPCRPMCRRPRRRRCTPRRTSVAMASIDTPHANLCFLICSPSLRLRPIS